MKSFKVTMRNDQGRLSITVLAKNGCEAIETVIKNCQIMTPPRMIKAELIA